MPIDDLLADVAAEYLQASGLGVPVGKPVKERAPVPWEPLPPQPGRGLILPDGRVVSPQQAAYESEADELFFGGSVGGSKSDLLLGLAMTRHRRSVIFRRERTQFRGALGLWERSKEIAEGYGDPNDSLMTWRNLPGDRVLEFGAVPHDRDKGRWRGRPHDGKFFDELPEFSEKLYRFLIAWLRTTVQGQRCRVVGTGNAPDMYSQGVWILRYWGPWLDPQHPRPAKPGELRWFAVDETGKDIERPNGDPFTLLNGQTVKPRSRTFIPARAEDNPYYMRTGYMDVLNNLPGELRSQLRDGNFQAQAPDHPWQVIPTAWVLAAQARWTADGHGGRPLDQAGVDPSRGGEDEFVVAPRHGAWVGPLHAHAASEAPDGRAGAALVKRDLAGLNGLGNSKALVAVDVIGTAGGSVYDHCVGLELRAVAMNGSEASYARDRSGTLGFANKRAEWHWKAREALDPAGGQELALPPDPQLRADLCAPRWSVTVRGILVEPKEAIKARLGRSPDRGEAVIYAVAPDVVVAALTLTTGDGASEERLPEDERRKRAAAREERKRAEAERAVTDAIRRNGVYWPGG